MNGETGGLLGLAAGVCRAGLVGALGAEPGAGLSTWLAGVPSTAQADLVQSLLGGDISQALVSLPGLLPAPGECGVGASSQIQQSTVQTAEM